MLNKTTVVGIQSLLFIALAESKDPIPLDTIAERLGASPQYLAKIHTQLAKAGILETHRGKHGGVTLARKPAGITLLEIVEACQGRILGDYCQPHDDVKVVCGFHVAMHDLQNAVVGALQGRTLADLWNKPQPDAALRPLVECRMACVMKAEE